MVERLKGSQPRHTLLLSRRGSLKFTRLHTLEQVKSLIEFHNVNSDHVVLDVETTSVNPREAKLIDIQLTGRNENEAVIFSAEIASVLTEISKSRVIVGHNYKYDAHVLFRHGINLLSHTWRDTMLIAHLLDENRDSYSLDSFVKENWNDDYKEKFWKKYKSYEEATEEDKVSYACSDIFYTGAIYRSFIRELGRESIPDSLVSHVHRLQSALLQTEIEGIKVDLFYLEGLGVKLKHRIDEIQPQMRSMVKDEIEIIELEAWQKEIDKKKSEKGKANVSKPGFNFESSKQLQELLYGGLGLPPQRNEKTKATSTDYASLEKIKEMHPVIGLIQENRELQKVYTAYVEGTLDRLNRGRIYPEFRVAGTVTGRLAAANPNLQQLPREGGVRGIYTPNEGYVLISADYASLEIYLAANFTKDPGLLRVVLNGESLHDVTAKGLGIDRQLAKSVNFAEGYGCSHFKLARMLGVSEKEGLKAHQQYWATYSGQKRFMDECNRKVDKGEPIVTPWGRRRRFEVKKRSPWDKAYRQSWNFLVQSTGADCTNKAFYIFSEHLNKTGRGRGWFPVHDELIAEVKLEYAQEELANMCQIMTGVGNEIGLEIPLKAEPSGPSERWTD